MDVSKSLLFERAEQLPFKAPLNGDISKENHGTYVKEI